MFFPLDAAKTHSPRDDRPKVAIIVRGFDLPSAVATSSLHHAEALANDYSVTIITDESSAPSRHLGNEIKSHRIALIYLHWLRRFSHVPNELLFILCVGFHLIFHHKRYNFNAVVFHSHPATALLAPLLKRWLSCRTVMVMHGDIFDRPIGTYDSRLTFWYRITTQRAYRVVDAVIALSPYMRTLAIRGGAHQEKVFIVPNGVDPQEIGLNSKSDEDLGELTTNITPIAPREILFIGRIEYNKGVDILVQAFARVKDIIPDVMLRCIGAPNQVFMRQLSSQIRQLSIQDSIIFTPAVSRLDLGSYYLRSTLVVVPSRSETQSTVLMESMAAGKPVVASDTGGNPMMVVENVTGLLFPSGDVEALSQALTKLLVNNTMTQAMGKAARQRHSELYSLAKTRAQFCNALNEVVSLSRNLNRP
ncbi:MAG: glycosyltransferase family 4 protein [Synechococcaceae cyanobacterium]